MWPQVSGATETILDIILESIFGDVLANVQLSAMRSILQSVLGSIQYSETASLISSSLYTAKCIVCNVYIHIHILVTHLLPRKLESH